MKMKMKLTLTYLLMAIVGDFFHLTKAQCDVCPDGTNVTNIDTVIPAFKLDDDFANPTCEQLQDIIRLLPLPADSCDIFHDQAGYCGCAGLDEPVNACFLCGGSSDDAVVGNPSKESPGGDTCSDLATYSTFLSAEDCAGPRGEVILAHAYFCECPGAQQACPMCADGQEIPDPTFDIPGDFSDSTCAETADIISTFGESLCEASSKLVTVTGIRCGCRDQDEFPSCAIQQNLEMCTIEMLDAIEEDCECYAWCDGDFLGCETFPGRLIQDCPGTPISGCNYANYGGESSGYSVSATTISFRFVASLALIAVHYFMD